MFDDSHFSRLLNLDAAQESVRERPRPEPITNLHDLYLIIAPNKPEEKIIDTNLYLIQPSEESKDLDFGNRTQKKPNLSRERSLEEFLSSYSIEPNTQSLLENYPMSRIQRTLEHIISRDDNHNPHNNNNPLRDEFTNLLDATKRFGKKHSEGYFAGRAMVMAGMYNRQLAGALARFQEGQTDAWFGPRYLRGFLKQDVSLSDAELNRYALKLDIQLDNSQYGHDFNHKYFDSKFNFCLTYDGQLIASVGFDACQGRMFIRQIQGIKGNRDRLQPIKWERALVSYAVEWAEKYGIPEVAIVSVDNHEWAEGTGHLDREQGKMLYDVTARRLGFRERDADGNYIKRLEAPVPIPMSEAALALSKPQIRRIQLPG